MSAPLAILSGWWVVFVYSQALDHRLAATIGVHSLWVYLTDDYARISSGYGFLLGNIAGCVQTVQPLRWLYPLKPNTRCSNVVLGCYMYLSKLVRFDTKSRIIFWMVWPYFCLYTKVFTAQHTEKGRYHPCTLSVHSTCGDSAAANTYK